MKTTAIRCRALIINDGKLLTVKQHKYNNFVSLPGGHLEWGENPQECMIREIVEELGVKPELGKLLYINNFMEEEKQSIEFFFEVTNSKDFEKFETLERTHGFELDETAWVSASDETIILPMEINNDFKAGNLLNHEPKFIKGSK